MTDAEVRQFINQKLREDPRVKKTPLLRLLRENDRACEQSRFGAIYQQVKEEVFGSQNP
jgi:hypothetical protein